MTYFFRHKRHGLVRKTVVFFLAEVVNAGSETEPRTYRLCIFCALLRQEGALQRILDREVSQRCIKQILENALPGKSIEAVAIR